MKHKKLMSAVLASAMLLTCVPSSILPVSAKDTDSGIQITTESTNNSDIQFDSSDDGISVDNSDSESGIVVSNTENAKVSQSGDTQDITISGISGQSEDALKATVENTTKKSLNVGDKAKLHVTAENASAEESVLRLYFCKVDGTLSSNKDDWGTYLSQPSLDLKVDGLNDKCELSVDVKDKEGNTSKSTVSFLKTVENDKVTSRYATLKLPAGAKTEFDLNVTSANQTTATIIPVMEQKGFRYKDAVSVKWEEEITFLNKVGKFFTGKKTTSAVASDDIKIEDVQGEEIKLETSSSVEQMLGASVTAEKAEVKTGKTSKLSVKVKNTSEKDATFKLYFSEVEGDLSSDKGEWLSYLRQPATNVSVDGFDKNDTKKVKITVDGKETEATLRIMKDVEDGKIVSRYMVMDLPAKATAEFDVSVLSNGAEKATFIPVIKQDGTNFGDAATVSWTGSKKKAVSVFDTDEIQGKEQEKNNVDETVDCDLTVHGGNGYIVIEDVEGTFEKSYRYEDEVLYDEDDNPVDDTTVKVPKSKDLTVSLVAEDHYCVENVSMKDVNGDNKGIDLDEELPALQTAFTFASDSKTSLDVEFLRISDKYLDLGVSAMDASAAGWWDQGTGRDLCHFLGIDGSTYYNYLYTHSQDNWYIGTAYATSGYADGANGIGGWVNGAGYGMNCEGFVDNVLKNTRASHPMAVSAGGEGWVHYMNHSDLKHYVYGSKQDMLNSGQLEYGDIIWMFTPNGHNAADAYHHIGIFVGNTSSEDKFWHSSSYENNKYGTTIGGNRITQIIPKNENSGEWVIVKAGAIRKTYTGLTVQKVWTDQQNAHGLRPSRVKINLIRWSNKDATRRVIDSAYINPSNNEWNWKVTWNNLVRTDGDITYEYTAEEEAVPNYEGSMSWSGSYEAGWTGVLTNEIKTYTSLAVKKEWDDQNDYFKVRPDSITVDLYWWSNKDSTRKLWKTATLSDANNWSVTWDNLPYAEGDVTYEYTAVERGPVDGYTGKLKWTGSYEEGWLGTITNTVQTGWLKLHKSSSLPDMTDGNACYDLTGAKYTVYTDEACTKEAIVGGELVTDKNGDTKAVELLPGDYWVKETKATDDGHYDIDKEPHKVTVSANDTTTSPVLLNVEDEPLNDPASITITKIWHGEKTETIPTLNGTQFTVCYYAGDYEKDTLPSKPTRKWVIEVKYNENIDKYMALLTDTYLVKGSDALYKSADGKATLLPFGTYTIQETKAAAGYTLEGMFVDKKGQTISPNEIYLTKVLKRGDSIKLDGGNEYASEDKPQPNSIKIKKFDSDGKTPLAGVTFELKDHNGKVVATKTTGSDGVIEFTDLYPDVYTVTEVETPNGHTLLQEPITVQCPMRVTEQQIKDLKIDKNQCTYDEKDNIYYIFDQTYNVTNDANFAIPHTGAMITAKRFIPIVCGMVVLMGATFVVLFKKKRRH